ncbi:MAG: leucine-rich repeat domain-containing protein [Lachnospiraceae bacterium]|nr:leucine-rich repeat domain-containing protein [Lachnospiraceae bacterium]
MLEQERFEIENGILKAYSADTETDIQIPEGVHTIGEGVFKGMSWILSVHFPESLVKIGASAFKGCRQIKKISFPKSLEEIGEYAFHKCHELEEIILPESMTQVGDCAFLYCDGLKRAVMEGPERMGKGVFSHNLSLEEIALNENMDDSNFSDEVFEGCVHLHKITLSGKAYEVDNLIEAMNSNADYPRMIKSIAKSVYHSMQIEDGVLNKFSINLKNISLPEGISVIGKGCFFDKKGIVSMTLPRSLKEIRANAFLNCIGLKEITFGNEDVILNEKAFRGCCNIKTVHLPDKTYLLEDEADNDLVSRIRDQFLGDFYISGRILVRYMGNEEQIQIPKGVEVIGERCFFGKEQLKTVLCPESLREIREQAFSGCVTLQTIVLPETLKRIEREAFAECRKLLKCNIPEGIKFIGEYAFRRCFQLKPFGCRPGEAEIHPYAFYLAKQPDPAENRVLPWNYCGEEEQPDHDILSDSDDYIAPYAYTRKEDIKFLKLTTVKRIGKYSFTACPNLEEIEIDAPDCVIEQNAFSTCPKLKRINLHVREIGKGVFSYCRELEEVRLSGISVLPAECFAGCYMLSKFEAKELTGMGTRCFDECVRLDYFDFSGIKKIGERAFERCDSLKTVKLSKAECGYHAFADCASLKSIDLTKDTTLSSGAFFGCTQIRDITVDGQKFEFCRFSDSLNRTGNTYPVLVKEIIASVYSCFDIQERTMLAGYRGDASRITIPCDIEEVGQDVFRDHIRLKEINIPESVRIFGSHAFSMTGWLEEQRAKSDMVIVNNILLDGARCEGKVLIPNFVKRVSSWCFAGNINIHELEIPSERIGIENLAFRNCLNLKKIVDWNKNVFVLGSVSDLNSNKYPELIQRIFTECINCFKLDGDCNLIESTGNITDLTFPEGIKAIGDEVYKDCHLLETIALSGDTERIGKSAFENSKWLKKISGAGAVSYIGQQAFSGCQSLEYIDLSDSLKEMGKRCFEHCGNLKEIYISNRLERIPERAFFRCKSLKRVIIPKSVKVVEKEAFAFCEDLEEVCIPEETLLSERVFEYCDHVKIFKRDDK